MSIADKGRKSVNWRKRYQDLVDSLNIGYNLADLDGNILEVNETLLKMTGTKREQIVGHNLREFFAEGEFEKMMEIAAPLREKGAYQYEFYLPTVNGERIPILCNNSINRDSEGRAESLSATLTDIRGQKEAQEELEREKKTLEAILFGIGDCVTIFDLDGTLLLSNPLGVQIRGERRTPLLPLKSGAEKELKLQVGAEWRQFAGRVEVISDHGGSAFAYVEILKDITDLIKLEQREQELFQIKRKMRRGDLRSEMIGVSGAMQKVFDLILRCAEVDSTILILGETGVGKELAARAIHSQSKRKDKPFVAVNCGALPDTLLESELFGHVKGAFTGAISERLGLFREAQGGVLFLDEVGDLSGPLQVKLLRALQEKEVRPVGGDRTYPVDVRVVAATNRNLIKLAAQERFRNDLYYRIAVIPLSIPSLRDRPDDILPLAEHFLKKHRERTRSSPSGLDHAAQQLLLEYRWPGNIRELENAMEHALAMARGPLISPADLPVQVVAAPRPPEVDESKPSVSLQSLEEAESARILDALSRHNGNRTRAAKDLGISRTTLWKKLSSIAAFEKGASLPQQER